MPSPAYDRIIDALHAAGCRVFEKSNGTATAQAPGHSSADRSITLAPADTYAGIVIASHADPIENVLNALGLTFADLHDEPRGHGRRPEPTPPTPDQIERIRKRDEMKQVHEQERRRELDEATRIAAAAQLGDDATPEQVGALASVIATASDPVADTPPIADEPPADPEPPADDQRQKSVATRLVELALDDYQLGLSDDEEPFGTSKTTPHIAMMLRGGRTGLRAELARKFFALNGSAAPAQALADSLTVLEGMAALEDPTRLYLRVAETDDAVYIDCGDVDGTVIRIADGAWELIDHAPVTFTRTKLTAMYPRPERGGDLAELWDFIPIAEQDRPVLLAVLVQALTQVDVAHPVLAYLAEQGSAKSSTTRITVDLLDPSPVPLRQAPRDADSWVTAAAGSWVVALDNLSGLPAWLSDSLCRASTGDGNVKRALYSDSGLSVVKFRRCVIINGIDLGALRGDLGERLALVDLPRIPKNKRRNEKELNLAWSDARPRIHGALLDLAARVHQTLPTIDLDEAPRMADFARVLAAVDQVLCTEGLTRYSDRAERIAEDSLSADDFIGRIRSSHYEADGRTSAEVLADIRGTFGDEKPPRDWPKNSRAVTTLLRRHAPALRAIGWIIDDDGGRNHRKITEWTITPPPPESRGKSDPRAPQDPQTASDLRGHGENPAGQTRVSDNAVTRTDPHRGLRGSRGNPSPAPDPHQKISEPAGQARFAGHAGHAGHEYASAPTTTPGGLTPDSPGQTDRVARALANARQSVDCRHCGEPIPEYAPTDRAAGYHSDRAACIQAEKRTA
ncbi:hypothetical protein [Gordonia humi]|uniref:hypothetical protein n=1 Tax=Gordonia humi TaxID=686429 RepID=UPI001620C443|nr:hypothetical protein [Gordonia humi]